MVALMAEDDDSLATEMEPRIADALRRVVLLRDRQHRGATDEPTLHAAEELVRAPLPSAFSRCREDAATNRRVEVEEQILGQGSLPPEPMDLLEPGVRQRPLAVTVAATKDLLGDADDACRPRRACILRPDEEADLTDRLRGDLPTARPDRELAVDLDPRDLVVRPDPVAEVELPVEVDLDERSHVRLFGLSQVVVVPAA